MAPGMAVGCVGLFVGGFGLGQIITATNILAGRRFTKHRGSGLALLNFSFSLGAMLSALLAAWLLPRFALRGVLVGFAGLFVTGAIWIGLEMPGAQAEVEVVEEGESSAGLGRRVYLYFAGLLILYGGLETCLSGWLTTFALRYGDRTLAVSEYTTLLLWMALTFGRVGSSLLMLRVGERTVQRIGLGLAAVFIVALGMSHTAFGIATFAVLLGLSLAPFFPATWALLMADKPTARQAGIVLAVSGLGAAALPWLMGVVSTRTGFVADSVGVGVGCGGGVVGDEFASGAAVPPGLTTRRGILLWCRGAYKRGMDAVGLLPGAVVEALERGSVVVTANQRTARSLRLAFDRRNRALGLKNWQPPAILAWDAWTAGIWRELLIAGKAAQLLLNQTQEHAVWRGILVGDAELKSLRSVDSLADMAAQAWRRLCSYKGRGRLGTGWSADTRSFQRWVLAFEQRCRREGLLSAAQLEETLRVAVEAGTVALPAGGLALVGFDGMTPAQMGLVEAAYAGLEGLSRC